MSKKDYIISNLTINNKYTEKTLFENNLVPTFIINYNFYCVNLLISLIRDKTIIFPDNDHKKNYCLLLNLINKGNDKIRIIESMINRDYIIDIYGKMISYSTIINKKITNEYMNFYFYYKKEYLENLRKAIIEYLIKNLNVDVIMTNDGYIDENNSIKYTFNDELIPEIIYGIRMNSVNNDFEHFINEITPGLQNNKTSYVKLVKFIVKPKTSISLLLENMKENIKFMDKKNIKIILLI